jgi:hypothetical protein
MRYRRLPRQAPTREHVDRDVIQAVHDQCRVLRPQQGGIAQPGDAQPRHAAATKQLAGGIFNSADASRKIAGSGLPARRSRPQTLAQNASCRVLPSARRIRRSMAFAFFDDEATAIFHPSPRSACTKRSASGKASTVPAWISSSSRACLRTA